jgi:hypothetical protein
MRAVVEFFHDDATVFVAPMHDSVEVSFDMFRSVTFGFKITLTWRQHLLSTSLPMLLRGWRRP